MRQPVADFDAALPAFSIADLQRIQFVVNLPVGIALHQFDPVLDVRRFEHAGERCFGNRLAAVLRQFGFRIERLHLADASGHKQPDHALRLRREMREPVRRSPFRSRCGDPVPLKHRSQSERREPGAKVRQKTPPRLHSAMAHKISSISFSLIVFLDATLNYRIVTKSLWLSRTRASWRRTSSLPANSLRNCTHSSRSVADGSRHSTCSNTAST